MTVSASCAGLQGVVLRYSLSSRSLSTTPLAMSPGRASTGERGTCETPTVSRPERSAANRIVLVVIVFAPVRIDSALAA